jgi:hypothetical protein
VEHPKRLLEREPPRRLAGELIAPDREELAGAALRIFGQVQQCVELELGALILSGLRV